MTRKVDSVHSHGLMEENIQVSGLMVSSMDMESFLIAMALQEKVNGFTESSKKPELNYFVFCFSLLLI